MNGDSRLVESWLNQFDFDFPDDLYRVGGDLKPCSILSYFDFVDPTDKVDAVR